MIINTLKVKFCTIRQDHIYIYLDQSLIKLVKIIIINASKIRFGIVKQNHTNICFKNRFGQDYIYIYFKNRRSVQLGKL